MTKGKLFPLPLMEEEGDECVNDCMVVALLAIAAIVAAMPRPEDPRPGCPDAGASAAPSDDRHAERVAGLAGRGNEALEGGQRLREVASEHQGQLHLDQRDYQTTMLAKFAARQAAGRVLRRCSRLRRLGAPGRAAAPRLVREDVEVLDEAVLQEPAEHASSTRAITTGIPKDWSSLGMEVNTRLAGRTTRSRRRGRS